MFVFKKLLVVVSYMVMDEIINKLYIYNAQNVQIKVKKLGF